MYAWISMSDSRAAVHYQNLSRDERRCVGRQEDCRADDIVGLTMSCKGSLGDELIVSASILEEGGRELGLNQARGNGINANVGRSQFFCLGLCESKQAGLADAVCGNARHGVDAGD